MQDEGTRTGTAPAIAPGDASTRGDRIRNLLLGARAWLAIGLFTWLLVSWLILASSGVYWMVLWARAPSEPSESHTVVVRNHGLERYFTPDQFRRSQAWSSAGWHWFGVSGVACVFGALLINSPFLLPRKLSRGRERGVT
jgi:hypothetical protein